MKLFKLNLIAFILALGTLVACTDLGDQEDTCTYTKYVPITEVTGPTNATINQEIKFSVKFNFGNNCGNFIGYNTTVGFPREIGAVGTYVGCDCVAGDNIKTEEYKFTATQAGEYELKFSSGTNQFITKIVTVTE